MDSEQQEGGRAAGPGLLLLLAGAALAWMGLDLLTGGALTRAVSGGHTTAGRLDGGQEESRQDGGT